MVYKINTHLSPKGEMDILNLSQSREYRQNIGGEIKKNKCQNCVGIHGAVRRFHTQYTDGSKHVTASRSSSLFEFASPYSTDLETQNCTLSCHWKPSTEDLHPTYIQTVLQSPQATHDNAVAVLTRQQYCACNLQRGR